MSDLSTQERNALSARRFAVPAKLSRSILSLGAVLLSALALTTLSMPSHATEEPEYRVVRELADVELRQYAAYTVAEVVVAGPADDAGKQAFPILARLQSALHAADLVWTGEAVFSRYNAPFTPWFMRRNEIWVHLPGLP